MRKRLRGDAGRDSFPGGKRRGEPMSTMADVARSAGVSVATVSHVLNETRPVLPHARQAVPSPPCLRSPRHPPRSSPRPTR
ncbi:LacI family DNA-binding transcriptional regulator [Streptomyces sp. NPDC007851]|uniref:LacI family DNA-binding transcriptional regulator n=1 Tax=Streptomyces sp. NPDC007851 TaxID=3155008 RepID=UPI0033E182E7